MTKPPLKKHHLLVLRALYDLHLSNKDWAYTFAMIGEQCRDGVLKSDVRRIVRASGDQGGAHEKRHAGS